MLQALEPTEEAIKERLLQRPVLHADETGLRVKNQSYWMQTASDDQWALLLIQASRGSKGIKVIGNLPAYTGTLVRCAHFV